MNGLYSVSEILGARATLSQVLRQASCDAERSTQPDRQIDMVVPLSSTCLESHFNKRSETSAAVIGVTYLSPRPGVWQADQGEFAAV